MAETLTLRQAAPVRWAKVVVRVDAGKARRVYEEWLSRDRPAILHSPDGNRRPWWLLRPLNPAREACRLPGRVPPETP